MTDLIIRRANSDDLQAICDVLRSSPGGAQWSEAAIAQLCAAGSVLVAELDGRITGFVVACLAASECEIENIAVAPEFRRHGIARQLVAEVIAQARQGDASAIYLEVRESSPAARELYRHFGFVKSSRRRNYYRDPQEDALILKLIL